MTRWEWRDKEKNVRNTQEKEDVMSSRRKVSESDPVQAEPRA